jgi:hypothetical protein
LRSPPLSVIARPAYAALACFLLLAGLREPAAARGGAVRPSRWCARRWKLRYAQRRRPRRSRRCRRPSSTAASFSPQRGPTFRMGGARAFARRSPHSCKAARCWKSRTRGRAVCAGAQTLSGAERARHRRVLRAQLRSVPGAERGRFGFGNGDRLLRAAAARQPSAHRQVPLRHLRRARGPGDHRPRVGVPGAQASAAARAHRGQPRRAVRLARRHRPRRERGEGQRDRAGWTTRSRSSSCTSRARARWSSRTASAVRVGLRGPERGIRSARSGACSSTAARSLPSARRCRASRTGRAGTRARSRSSSTPTRATCSFASCRAT